jgi:NAD(P)H-nitrite reductase large subunit
MKVLIIGNSAAGTAAIEAIRAHDKKSEILQLTDEMHPLYSRCLISYYLAGKIDKAILSYREPDFHERMGVELRQGVYVTEVDPAAQRVRCMDGATHPFDKLLISTGSSAKIPDMIPGDLDGVFVLRTIADAELIKQRVLQAKSAVILGGGLVGMRAADALSQCGLKVKVIVGSNRILSRMIDFEAAQIIRKKLERNSIEVMTETEVSEVMHKGHEVVGVRTSQGRSLDCEILVVAKSVRANTGLIERTDIKTRWGIETDSTMQTSHENIFAAGDVAESFDITTEEHTVNALWTCAVQQGRVAGENIAGKKSRYAGSVGMNSLNFWGIPLISFGITAPKDESRYETIRQSRPEQNIYKKVIIGNNRVKGLVLVGSIANAGVLFSLIQNRMDVSSFKGELLGDHFNFGKVIRHGSKSVLEKYYKGCSYVRNN